jgi:hypothetical protein
MSRESIRPTRLKGSCEAVARVDLNLSMVIGAASIAAEDVTGAGDPDCMVAHDNK